MRKILSVATIVLALMGSGCPGSTPNGSGLSKCVMCEGTARCWSCKGSGRHAPKADCVECSISRDIYGTLCAYCKLENCPHCNGSGRCSFVLCEAR